MRNRQSLTAVIALAVCAHVVCYADAVEFEQQRQLQADHGYGYYSDGPSSASMEQLSRTHHGKLKMKKLKKRLLLQCLLGHGQRRRRDTDAASGRFLLPIVLQSTNVNVGSGGGGGGGDPQHQYGSYGNGGGCMQMLNDHGPLQGALGSLGSLGSSLGSLSPFGSSMGDAMDEGSRNGLYADWNRYGRQFHRNFVRPLYRLF